MTDDDVFQEGYELGYQEAQLADLSNCPYFTGSGQCSYGCQDEPACHTNRPREGWPTENHPFVKVLEARIAERDLELASIREQFDVSHERCCLCNTWIENGYIVTDDDGYQYCEDCWQP